MTYPDEIEETLEKIERRYAMGIDPVPGGTDVSQATVDVIEAAAEFRLENGTNEPLPDELREELEAHGFDPSEWPPTGEGAV